MIISCPNCLTRFVFSSQPRRMLEIRHATAETTRFALPDDSIYSAVFSFVGRRSSVEPEFLYYIECSDETFRRFAQEHHAAVQRRLEVGDIVTIVSIADRRPTKHHGHVHQQTKMR